MGYNLTLLGGADRVLGKIFSEKLWTGGLFKKKKNLVHVRGKKIAVDTGMQKGKKKEEYLEKWRDLKRSRTSLSYV